MRRIAAWTALATLGIIATDAPRAAAYPTSSVGNTYGDTTLHNLSCPSGEEVEQVWVGRRDYLTGLDVRCPSGGESAGDLSPFSIMLCAFDADAETTVGLSGSVDSWGGIDGEWIAELNLQCRHPDGSIQSGTGIAGAQRGVGTRYFSLRCATGDVLSGIKVFLGNSNSVIRRIASRCAE